MQALKVTFILIEVLLLFNLLILVHELGHFLAARWRGLKVERFGIWFGKPLWKKEVNGVVYCLGCIPAGGYVALPQMAPMDVIEGKTDTPREALPPVTALDKIIVAFAGPLFSLGLALAFACGVTFIGRPVGEAETTTVIGHVIKDGPAAQAGLKPGDRILSVDGYPVNRFSGIGDSVMWRVVSSEGETIPIQIEREGKVLTFETGWVREETSSLQRKSLRQIKILPKKTALVASVEPNSPAQRAGLRPNDIVLEVDDQPVLEPATLGEYIEERGPGQPITLEVLRGADLRKVTLAAEMPIYPPEVKAAQRRPLIGIKWELSGLYELDYPDPWEQLSASVRMMVKTFAALFSPKSDVKAQHLTGPLGILRIYYMLFDSEHGWRQAIWFSVILNVNLALLNLLPIPVLDGGHILLALIEAGRRRPVGPVGARVITWVQSACAFLIIGYILYISFFDVQDFRWQDAEPPKVQFAPQEPAP